MGENMKIEKIDKNMAQNNSEEKSKCLWIDLNNKYLRGTYAYSGFSRIEEGIYISEKVEVLKKHTSGINITFKTDSQRIRIKAKVGGQSYMAHMTAVGQIGFDLYCKINGRFRFIETTKVNASEYEVLLLDNLEKEEREFRVYFPLYMRVEEAYIGIEEQASFEFIKKEQEKIVIYGTSISQGGCATRPGMSYSNILDRKLDYEFINLGFSGSAHMEDRVIDLLNSIDMKYLIIEVESNNTVESMSSKMANFINRLEAKNIIVISKFPYPHTMLYPNIREDVYKNKQLQANLKNITFLDGEKLLEELDYDDTVDGVHLTDLGFYHLANKLIEYLQD